MKKILILVANLLKKKSKILLVKERKRVFAGKKLSQNGICLQEDWKKKV